MSKHRTVRLDDDLDAAIEKEVARRRINRSVVINEALREQLINKPRREKR